MGAGRPTSVEHALSLLERLEDEIRRLYGWFRQVFADDAEASELFATLERDEARHRDLVRFQRQLARPGDPQDSTAADARYLPELLKAIAAFRQNKPHPTLHEAIAFAIGIEDSPAEAKYRTAVADASPNIASLISSLNQEDERHGVSLHEFAARRGFA